jgi:hypothetical protein
MAMWTAMPAPASAGPRELKDFFGVSPAVIITAEELDRMQAAGIHTMRFPIFWPIIQPDARGGRPMSAALDFDRYDPVLLEAAKRGIRILPFVYGTPTFLTGDFTVPPLGSAELRREWRLLLRALQDRYGRGGDLWEQNPDVDPRPVMAWQIWNEPSSESFWKNSKSSPRKYAKLLEVSDRALSSGRGAGPKLIAAGLFGSPTHGIDMPTFLERFYKVKGVKNHFDALALHPYAPGLEGMKLQLRIGRAIMKSAGDGDKPLWITEIGWPTDGNPQNPFYTTPSQQAKLLRRSFSFILEKREPWVIRKTIWYTWRDNNVNEACDLCRYSGLFDADGNPKPSWQQFVKFSGGTP